MSDASRAREQVYRELFDSAFTDILGYALRRTGSAADAADAAAETMLVAWRRLDDVPTGAQARPWLYGVARRVLANHHRGEARRCRLGEQLRDQLPSLVEDDPAARVEASLMVNAALAALSPGDRELLTLTEWEGLTPGEVAAVMGLAAPVVRTRLRRARARLRTLLADEPAAICAIGSVPGHVVDDGPVPVREEMPR